MLKQDKARFQRMLFAPAAAITEHHLAILLAGIEAFGQTLISRSCLLGTPGNTFCPSALRGASFTSEFSTAILGFSDTLRRQARAPLRRSSDLRALLPGADARSTKRLHFLGHRRQVRTQRVRAATRSILTIATLDIFLRSILRSKIGKPCNKQAANYQCENLTCPHPHRSSQPARFRASLFASYLIRTNADSRTTPKADIRFQPNIRRDGPSSDIPTFNGCLGTNHSTETFSNTPRECPEGV